MQGFAPDKYKKISKLLLVAIALITAASIYICREVKFDYDFESFFPRGDKDLSFYLQYRNNFEYDNEFVLVGIENTAGIFQRNFLKKIQQLSDSLSKTEGIQQVLSPTNASYKVIGEIGAFDIPYLQPDSVHLYKSDSAVIYCSEEMVGTLFAKNAKSVCLFIKTREGISKKVSDTILFKMERLLDAFHFNKVHVAGKLKAQLVYVDRIQKEFIIFLFTSIFLIVIFLYFSFRSFWGIWIPITVVLLSIIWLLAFMTLIGKPLDLMTVLLPTMLFVVGMSDVVHILTKYLEELRDGKDNYTAFRVTIKDVGFPTLLTLLTTAIGFLTLLYSNIKPLRDFGIYTSLGITIAFILAFTFLPALILFVKKPLIINQPNESLFWNKTLHRLLAWIFKNKKKIIGGVIIVSLVSIYGASKIRVNNYLLEDIADSDNLKQDFFYFENEFSGVRPFELKVWVKDSSKTILDQDVLLEMDQLQNFCKKHYGVGFIISPLTLVKNLNKAHNGGDNAYYKIPTDKEDEEKITNLIRRYKKKNEIKTLLSANLKEGRITGKMQDLGSAKMRELNESFYEWWNRQAGIKYLDIHFTGAATLMDKNNEYLTNNMIQGIFLSVLVVAFIIALIYRSLKIAVISIIPNLIPMLVMGGIMGLMHIELKVSTSIIFSIAFGIATDDTIHFLARLKLELSKGKPLLYAIKRTYISTGKAVVVTSLILSAGFLSLIFSNFQSTFYFGLLTSITLLIAVITDLLVLPLLLLWLHKRN